MAEQKKPKNRFIPVAEFCVRSHGAECERCRIACPHGAITYAGPSSTPRIDEEACSKCGICMGVCDGFASTRVSIPNLHAHIRKIALRGELVYLTCKENIFPGFEPASNVVVLPCLACISPEFWTLMLAENIPLVLACDFKYCSDCNVAPERGELLYTRAIQTAESWSGGSVRFDKEIPEKPSEAAKGLSDTQFGRREAFDSIKGDVVDVVSGRREIKNSETLQTYYEKKERKRAVKRLNLADNGAFINEYAPGGSSATLFTPRRKMLLEAISRKPEIAGHITTVISDTDQSLCDGCLQCTQVCMTGARNISRDNGSLTFDAKLCIGCGACVTVCPKGACDLVETSAEAFGLDSPEEEVGTQLP